jgi:ATP/ADP translocase/HEAT repeat protein/CRP-like cAMP-binding protein
MRKLLSPIVELREEETATALLMFAYTFLLMWSYNIIKPITRSAFIKDLGADNIPWMPLVASFVIAALMAGYTWLVSKLPRHWALPIIQVGMAAVLVGFWFLFKTESKVVAAGFYLWGLLLGILLTSQFWTLANVTYDPRQAKRVFGFIGGGAPLGGLAGAYMAYQADFFGTFNLLLYSAGLLSLGGGVVSLILAREKAARAVTLSAETEKGVGFGEALRLLGSSKHLQVIAIVISFAAIGANIIEQQLNMATEAFKGRTDVDALTSFLGLVAVWMSGIAFFVQVWLTSRIHRYLGIGFALLVLPMGFGITALVMLLNAALWAPSLARVLDQSLRYTVDKTSREILFLPLPADLKHRAKPFVDVTVDRIAKGVSALLLLVLVQPWGLNLDWQQISYASLVIIGLWITMTFRAKRGYVNAFRQSIERRDLRPAELRLNAADLSTIEALVQELSHPQPARVLYAIEMLESLEKANLVTPLLLYHESPEVRERTLRAIGEARSEIASQWVAQVRRALGDQHSNVRAAALRALGAIAHEDAATLARPLLADADPRIRATAAVALTVSENPSDLAAAEATLGEIVSGTTEETRVARREVAAALGQVRDARFQRLLIPLLYDPSAEVTDEAMESVRKTGSADFMFVPVLVSLLRNRHLKGRARDVLVSYGEEVIEPLAYFMADENEDAWIRRHIPSTIAMLPSQQAVDALVPRLDDRDGFLRYKVMGALGRIRRADESLKFPADRIEAAILREARHCYTSLSLRSNLETRGGFSESSLLITALSQKFDRGRNRIHQLLALIYPPTDIAAAQWTLEHGDARNRASASEYLDNLLTGAIRKMVMPIVEDLPIEERVRRANVLIRTRPRDAEETLLQLINDDDQVVSACAIDLVRHQRMWSLANDIEHVLAHRDARDWFVFEAASWALAEQRMPVERRRELWLEPLPAAVLASELRALPLFASVSVDELFRIAEASRQVRHEPGTTLLVERSVPEMFHVLLDGQVAVTGDRRQPETVSAPAPFGFMEILQSKPMRRTVRAAGRAVTLALTAEELRTQLAYNPELVRGLFATMAGRAQKAGMRQVFPTGAARELEQLAANGLQPVDKVLAIQRVPIFKHLSAEEARNLAAITRTVEMTEGMVLFQAADRPAAWLIATGEVQLEADENRPAMVARGGDAIGSFAALGGPQVGQNARVTAAGIALHLDRDDLFELLGDRPEMLKQLFAGIMDAPGQAGIDESSTTGIPIVVPA